MNKTSKGNPATAASVPRDSGAPTAETALPPELVERLLLDALPIEPPAERAAALKARVLALALGDASDPAIHYQDTVTIRAGAGEWLQLAPKVHLKRLHREGEALTYLLRLDPGGVVPSHAHDGDEECFVLEGEAFLGELRVSAGDYHLAPRGTRHGEIRSPGGAVLFLRSAAGVPFPA